MRPVRLGPALAESMKDHARQTYPDECCGFLISEPDPDGPSRLRTIVAVEPAPNEYEGERRRRFLVRADELRAAELRFEGSGRIVAGFYHSHPDHPARPSQFDQEHAWPWYTYIVLGVTSRSAEEVRAFELDADRRLFAEVPIVNGGAAPGTHLVTAGSANP